HKFFCGYSQVRLFQKGTAGFLKCCGSNAYMRIRIGCARIIDSLHFRPNCLVFRLGSRDANRSADMNEGVKFRGCLTMQANATMRPRHRMHEALMKAVCWRELAPESHWVTNIVSGNIRTSFRRHHSIALHPESVGTGALVFLFAVNGKISPRRRFGGNANTACHGHQATVTFHDVNVLFRKRHFHYYLRWIIWFVSRYMIRAAARYSRRFATGEDKWTAKGENKNKAFQHLHNSP